MTGNRQSGNRLKSEDRKKVLVRLAKQPAVGNLTETERVVVANRRLIKKAMRMGHGLDVLSLELRLPKRTLQRHMNMVGLFFRKPRSKKGEAVKRNAKAILRAKQVILANV